MAKTTLDWAFLTQLGSAAPTAPAGPTLDELIVDDAQVVAGRYQLGDLVGRGGGGQVFRAHDRLTGEDVALKLLGSLHGDALARVRREITALRWLRLPGVVQLRDSGLWRGEYFLVMDLVEGRPFPGPRLPVSWEGIASVSASLLEVLARVHMAGVVHRDLKPANVLVDRAGRPIVLDFGLAQGRAVSLAPVKGKAEGTPAYVAPEQIRSGPADGRTDLYALGCMLYEALSGTPPHFGGASHQILQRRLSQPAPPLHSVAPDVPERVARLVDRLLQRDPDDRPATAAEALEALGGHPDTLYLGAAADLPVDHILSMEELRPLFAGPDPFLHLVEDGARVLYARTGGHPLLVQGELGGWVRAGLAHWEHDRLVISRAALERLERGLVLTAVHEETRPLSPDEGELLTWARLAWPDATPALLCALTGRAAESIAADLETLRAQGRIWDLPDGRIGAPPGWKATADLEARARRLAEAAPPRSEARLRGLLAAGGNAEALLDEIEALASHWMDEGRGPRALALLELALELLGELPDPESRHRREDTLLRAVVSATLRQESEPAMERALYELGRSSGQGEHQVALANLVLGTLAARRKEATRALEVLPERLPFDDEVLDVALCAARVRARAFQGTDAEARQLDELSRWAERSDVRRAALSAWQGNLAYRCGRIGEAADHHRASLRARRRPEARMASALNLASALVDLCQLDEADVHAAEVEQIACSLRQPTLEALATLVRRSVGYRVGRLITPRPDLVEAAAQINPYLEALAGVNEAALAWRAQQHALARTVAARAFKAAEEARRPQLSALAYGLESLCGAEPQAARVSALEARASACAAPGLRVQLYGMLGLIAPSIHPNWIEQAEHACRSLPRDHVEIRREVLSVAEALAALHPPASN